jgi:hypothetical protein
VATAASSFPWVTASLIAKLGHDNLLIAKRRRRLSNEDIELTSA